MVEGKTQENYFYLVICLLYFLICSEVIQFRKFVYAL